MDWLNYHHLYYFWTVAKLGNLTRACEKLRLAKPTVSGQIHRLEEVLGEKLFRRSGRRLVMTEIGRVVFRYSEEIFSTGQELMEAIRGEKSGRPSRLAVGVAGVLPKPIVHRLLEPAFHLEKPTVVHCHEDRSVEQFLVQLAGYELDMVLSDAPAGQSTGAKVFSHHLGECGTTFYAIPRRAKKLRRGFPKSLHEQAFLLPSPKSMLRKSLNQWFFEQDLRPIVMGEFDDPALMDFFGQSGMGVFPGPSVIESDFLKHCRVEVVGRAPDLRHQFYALSAERRLANPAVVSIRDSARRKLFG